MRNCNRFALTADFSEVDGVEPLAKNSSNRSALSCALLDRDRQSPRTVQLTPLSISHSALVPSTCLGCVLLKSFQHTFNRYVSVCRLLSTARATRQVHVDTHQCVT